MAGEPADSDVAGAARIAAKLAPAYGQGARRKRPGENPSATAGRLERPARPSARELSGDGGRCCFACLQNDPSLKVTGWLFLTSFTERSVDADLGLALVRYARESVSRRRTAEKFWVMSADTDKRSVCRTYLDAASGDSQSGAQFFRWRWHTASA